MRVAVAAAAILAAILAAPGAAAAQEPGLVSLTAAGLPACIDVRVAVVVFDLYGGLDARYIIADGLVTVNVTRVLAGVGTVDLCYNVSLTGFQAGPGEAEALASRLSRLYEYPALVWWSDFEPPSGYARLRLVEAYGEVYRAALEVLRGRGVDPAYFHDLVVIIGDLDGVSRVYYEFSEASFLPEGVVRMEGVRGWGGLAPMTFYDLSVVQKPWPDYEVPYHDRAPPASPETEPPIWLLVDPNAYAAVLVEDHVRYHVIGETVTVPATLDLNVTVAVVSFGDEARLREILGQVEAGVVELFSEALAPWVDVSVTVIVVDAGPGLTEAYEEAPVDDDGYRALDYIKVYGELAALAESIAPPPEWDSETATWVFLVLATPEPAYFTYSGYLNFTGFASASFGATTYPGYKDRVYKSGLPNVVAHEVGHVLGEAHPFQFYGDTRWMMDLVASAMSYYDPGMAGLGGYYHYSTLRLSHLQAIQYYMKARELGVDDDVLGKAARLIGEYRGPEALELLLNELGHEVEVPAVYPGQGALQGRVPGEPEAYAVLVALLLLLLLALAARTIL